MNELSGPVGEDPMTLIHESDEAGLTASAAGQRLENYRETISQLAGQADADGFYGLHDAGSLIVEALNLLTQETAPPELFDVLADLPDVFGRYCFGDETSIPPIIQILAYPGLQIPLDENELAMLANQLATELTAQNLLDDGNWEADDFFADLEGTEPSSAPSKETLELVELLEMEAALISRLLSSINLEATGALTGQLEALIDNLERYENAANMAGFEGLAMICGHVNANVRLFCAEPGPFTAGQLQAMRTWISGVHGYLANFSETGAGLAMLPQLGEAVWALPISMDDAAKILEKLQTPPGSGNSASEAAARQQTATAEDVSLDLPDDVNEELLDILLQELPVQTQVFSSAIQTLRAGGSLADLETAQRIAHTVKGAANTVGIKGIAQLTHFLEDILVACAEHQKLPGHELLNTLVDAADCLEAMSESLNDLTPPPVDALETLQKVLDWANRIDAEGIGEIEASDSHPAHSGPQTVASGPEQGLGQAEVRETPVEKAQTTMVRVAAEQMEAFFRQAGENIILNSQANERLRRIKNQLQAMEAQFELLRQLGEELDQLIDLKDLSGRSLMGSAPKFDVLEMDQYNELHTASRRMVEAAFDARELNLDASKELEAMNKLLEDQQRLATETQEAMMKTRLVPVSSIIPRLQRSLRQTCRLTGKNCDLSVSGEHLMVDGDTLNSMVDPLMHLLRNAVDHGIEHEQARLALGKPQQGHISIEFDRDGNHIAVRIKDDGRGLDYAAIRNAAEQRGAVTADQAVTEDDLKRFILRPNFSTRTQTTQTSGRGVGMDVVNYEVLAQGGTLALHSVPGQGLAVEIKIPLPLSRSHALLTDIGPYRLALSNKGIRQILFIGAGDLGDDGAWLTVDEATYPAISLNKLLNLPDYLKAGHRTALLVQNNDQTTAVLLDEITDSLDIVIKSLGFYIKKIPGFTGAAIMGDGSVAPVLDLPELLRTAGDMDGYEAYFASPGHLPVSTLPTVLVVDDSLSQRRALEQLLQDAGFQVKTARDGIEAAEQLAEYRPDIVLTDLEMPRMNGIELTAHIRTREHLKSLPVIMITSRTTQTHRKMAEEAGINGYLVKPVREDDLLATIQHLLEGELAA